MEVQATQTSTIDRPAAIGPDQGAGKAVFSRRPSFWVRQVIPADSGRPWKRLASRLANAFVLMVVGHVIFSSLPLPDVPTIWAAAQREPGGIFLVFVLTGFLAQLVDGALGMGYGVISAICLISAGISPVSVSAAIHTSEVFSSGISGYSHYRFGNINKKLFRHLVVPGVAGAVLGAIALISLGERAGSWLMPLIAVYALFLGIKILLRAFGSRQESRRIKRLGWLAGAGGFFDSFGGGGWGPIVTSTLIAKGRTPRYIIGSVSLTEFFITLASAFTFFAALGTGYWQAVLGLLIGGTAAAPVAARLAGKLPAKQLLLCVGAMVILWSARILWKYLV
jgi:uncharacterized membrane protein YfcA